MPTFKVPPENDSPTADPLASKKGAKRYPTVYLPVSPEIIAALKVGGPVVVTIEGKVVSLSSNKNSSKDRHELTVELREVDAYPSEADEEKAEVSDPEETMEGAISTGLKQMAMKGKAK